MCFPLEFWKDLENSMTFWKSNIKNCSFGCFFYAFMGENWMTKMLENWEVTDTATSHPTIYIFCDYILPQYINGPAQDKGVHNSSAGPNFLSVFKKPQDIPHAGFVQIIPAQNPPMTNRAHIPVNRLFRFL